MKKSHESSAQSPESLLANLHALVTEAEKMMGGSQPAPSDEALGAIRERFAAAQESLIDLYTGARKKVVAGVKYTDETIRAHPYQSLAIAAGVGLLIGVLVGRRTT